MTIYWDGILEAWSVLATAVIGCGVPALLCMASYLAIAWVVTRIKK